MSLVREFHRTARRRGLVALVVAGADQNVTGCPPVQEAGPLDLDEIEPPARLEITGQTSAPAVITRATQRITLRFRILACDGRTVRGALVYATRRRTSSSGDRSAPPTATVGRRSRLPVSVSSPRHRNSRT